METGTVFTKTHKGHEEIDKRTYHLNFKHRTALIMVDGENAVEALLGNIPGNGVALLEDLLRDGFIAATGSKSKGGSVELPAGSATGTPVGVGANFDLEIAKRNAVKFVVAVLGPGGESLAIAIEGCNTQAEFKRQAQRTRGLISQVGGQRKAAEFWAQTGLAG